MRSEIFRLYKEFTTGGRIEIVAIYKKKADHNDLMSISRLLAKEGYKVQITTDIHFKDPLYSVVFGDLTGTKYERKCPDLIIDGRYYEVESYTPPFKREKVNGMFSKGLKQSSNIIINNTKGASDRYIRKIIFDHIRVGHQVNEVWLYEKGTIRLLYKKSSRK